ncbi:sucraseferredoxin-like family protein [Angomonas deanei]|uniref:Sucrase/ferredoxin-like, putative n=1 Tax=Angomonas deanei TaxID=59799 RepID=S9W9H3_9TRYP|nr:sucraseferredoxin-like family protein [Angomonas deanei]EPY40108.1 sucraseferredoxin-like family protein [Angomonas deanei]EPY43663.1 sucraseferredoxin-like family protein [Angomonas deanei]CAD2213236.1 Sucrase/ferredoxin-like, putative [Angomonas deanei]|eukprot:EPY32555.1 sucraseferredoxin-like family protein [Angomonas deanei]
MADPNDFETFKHKLTQQTLQDIEGLDVKEVGFGREECCGPIPPKLKNSMKLNEHIFIGTKTPAPQWDKRTENIEGYPQFSKIVKEKKLDATVNVYEVPEGQEENVLHVALDEKTGALSVHQYNNPSFEEFPWENKGTLSTDRSNEYFVFVCAHSTRDSRCAYCGAILVDLLRSAVKEKLIEEEAKKITIVPCSHVGGHIYAGNVLVYSRHGGVCFGLFKPVDVDALIEFMKADSGVLPVSLRARVRGQMLLKKGGAWCSSM